MYIVCEAVSPKTDNAQDILRATKGNLNSGQRLAVLQSCEISVVVDSCLKRIAII